MRHRLVQSAALRKVRQIKAAAFSLIELLVVITVIAILAALALRMAGYIQRKAAIARTQATLSALETALAGFKADHGDYPIGSNGNPLTAEAPGPNHFLYTNLVGEKVYGDFNRAMLSAGTGSTNLIDAFGEPFGYYYDGTNGGVMNGKACYDLWSRAATVNTNQWIRNW